MNDPLARLLHLLRSPKPPTELDRRGAASAPGTLVHVGERVMDQVSYCAFEYCEDRVLHKCSTDLEDCLAIDNTDAPAWIQVCGLHDTEAIGRLLSHYGIHPLIQEDVLNTRHRVKVENFEDYVFVAAKEIVYERETQRIDVQHLSIIFNQRVLISFQENPSTLFAPIEERIHTGRGVVRRRGTDYLLWAILDSVADHYRIALDQIVAEVDALSDFEDPSKLDDSGLHALSNQVDHLYRSIRPLREIALTFKRLESPLIHPDNRIYWSDLHDHAVQAVEMAEHISRKLIRLEELRDATLDRRLNEVMRFLTALSTIFLPLTFLAGVYGMNFRHMPELEWAWAYPAVWVVFGMVTVGLWIFFNRRGWM